MKKIWETKFKGSENHSYIPFSQERLAIYKSILYTFWDDTIYGVETKIGDIVWRKNFLCNSAIKNMAKKSIGYVVKKLDFRNISISNSILSIEENGSCIFSTILRMKQHNDSSVENCGNEIKKQNRYPYITDLRKIDLLITPSHGETISAVSMNNFKVISHNLRTRKIEWEKSFLLIGSACYLPVILKNNIYIIVEKGFRFIGYNIDNGDRIAEYKLPAMPISSPISDGKNLFFLFRKRIVAYEMPDVAV
jgi:hypothetical protein